MKHRDYVILTKIVSEIQIAEDMLLDTKQEDFEDNEILKRATSMTVINIGELAKNISEETRMKYTEVPWRQATGFRDVAAHKYQTLNMGDVYSTVVNDFPEFKQQLGNILANETDERE